MLIYGLGVLITWTYAKTRLTQFDRKCDHLIRTQIRPRCIPDVYPMQTPLMHTPMQRSRLCSGHIGAHPYHGMCEGRACDYPVPCHASCFAHMSCMRRACFIPSCFACMNGVHVCLRTRHKHKPNTLRDITVHVVMNNCIYIYIYVYIHV